MRHLTFQTPDWYQALTLTERLRALQGVPGHLPNGEVNGALAERRVQRWRSQPPFTAAERFAQRLAMDGLSEHAFRQVLGEPVEAIQKCFPAPPTWLAELARAYARPVSPEPLALPEGLHAPEMARFLDAIAPLIGQGRDRLREGVQGLIAKWPDLPFDPGTVEELLFANLPGRLFAQLARTLALELHVARLQGLLSGDTAEERFRSFLERLRQRETALAIFQEYPVLARQLTLCIDNWVAFSLEFLQHLCADWEAIRTNLSPGAEPGVLVEVDGSAGDSHRGGRAVLIARFSAGFQVVYKPKSMAVDVHFQQLLSWLNERGDHPPFRTLQVLDRGKYGWVEFVAAAGCTSLAEVRRFYERQGGYLALLHVLAAADFHFENLIAAGEHPVLLDLEALFHRSPGGMDRTQADGRAIQAMQDSVLAVGLLPQRLFANAESEGIDISGLGAEAGQILPNGVPHWEGAGTDEMRLTRKQGALPGGRNRPLLDGKEVPVLNHVGAIETGFTRVYQLLREHRDELLADDGLLARFADDEVRFIARPTRTYSMLLQDGFHPDLLRDALDRDRLWDRLWIAIEQAPHLARLIPAERDDLHQGDIPLFTTRPGRRDLWSSSGERLPDFFDESGLARAQQRLRRLGDDDLARQLWFLRASLAMLPRSEDVLPRPVYDPTPPVGVADRQRLLAAARAVGDRLGELALHGEGDATWVGLSFTGERHWSLVPLGSDLYDGLPGVALFLAYLGAQTGEGRYTALARGALATMRRQLERNRAHVTWIGGFAGWGGIIYTLSHLGVLWDQPALLAEAEEVVKTLPALIEQDEKLDVIGGAAGCLAGLFSLYHAAPSERTLAAAVRCGDRLLARAQPMEQGLAWITMGAGTRPLTGFAHGAAGIAWALLELAARTGEARFRSAALAGIAYERSLFSPEAGNWPDLRDLEPAGMERSDRSPSFGTTWCHGAPGIGLARLRCLPHLDDAAVRAEIDTALATTRDRGFGHSHTLCHGDLGNLELLLLAVETLGDPRWRFELDRRTALLLESIRRNGWLCATPLGVESPGLMTGLAGIGYGLLRLAEPQRVPSVLALAPPAVRPS